MKFRQISKEDIRNKNIKFNENKIYVVIYKRDLYKLHYKGDTYSFISLKDSMCHASGFYKDIEGIFTSARDDSVYEFNNQEDMILFLAKLVTNTQWKSHNEPIETYHW